MSSKLSAILGRLQGELFFYLEDGPLKRKLIENYLDQEEAHAEILECEHNASVRIKPVEGTLPPSFDCRLEAEDLQYQVNFSTADFAADEIAELLEQLRPHCPAPGKKTVSFGRNIIRKKPGSELLNIAAAATVLGLSHRSLKSLIPCSETRIAEKGGNKAIKEYYWDKVLIGRLKSLWQKQQAGRGDKSADLSFIAESCCDGDRRWARELIHDFLQQCRPSGD